MSEPGEPEIQKIDTFKLSGIGGFKSKRIVLVLTSDRFTDQLERIRFSDKVAEWEYETVVCSVSSIETERIGNMDFNQLSGVIDLLDQKLKLLGELDITLIAMDELVCVGLSICLRDYNISKVVLLNPVFCKGISVKLSRIEIPAFILYSGNAKSPAASSSRKYHDLIAGSSLHSMPDAPVGELLAKKTQFFSYLKSFLANDQ